MDGLYLHRLIRASAGSGKTFALANRYVDLLFHDIEVQNILATTFTRKASAEILGRVLRTLAESVEDSKTRHDLAQHLTGLTTLTKEDCEDKLARLAKNLHKVSVTTIDGFFNSIVNCFSTDLGIPVDPKLTEAGSALPKHLRSQAIEAMFSELDIPTLISLLEQYHHNQASRSVTNAIDSIIQDFYIAYQQVCDRQKWDCLPNLRLLDSGAVEKAIAALKKMQAHLPLTKQGTVHKRFKTAWAKSLKKAEAGQWEDFLGNGIAKAIVDSSKEDKFDQVEIPAVFLDVYAILIKHAGAVVMQEQRTRHLAIFDLMRRFDVQYRRILQQNNVLLFSDLTHILANQMAKKNPGLLAEIYFRLDGKIDHLLLDEFQDTSLDQWKVLEPVAREMTGDETNQGWDRTFFCVGDTKQAIYGWRGGCVQLFDQLPQQLYLKEQANEYLTRSWRSSPVVLGCVNQVFESITDQPVLQQDPADASAAQQFFEHYKHHTPADKNKDLPGYACLLVSDPPSESENKETAYSYGDNNLYLDNEEKIEITSHELFAANRIKEIYNQFPGQSIGVLTRSNDLAVQMIYQLRKLGILVSGEGGGALTDCAPVTTILSALALADNPGDQASAFHVVYSPLGAVVGLQSTNPLAVQEAAHRIRQDLLDNGYSAVLSNWVKQLADSCDENNLYRLCQLPQLAEQYDGIDGLRPSVFIKYVENTRVQRLDKAPVQVMTIHKSKGLEFDFVVLPELDKTLSSSSDKYILSRESVTGPVKAVYPTANELVRFLCKSLAEEYGLQRSKIRFEDLCNLYVAMTRARQGLYMIVKPPKKKSKADPLTYATLLRRALIAEDHQPDGDHILYQSGQVDLNLFESDKQTKMAGRPGLPNHTPDKPTQAQAVCNPEISIFNYPVHLLHRSPSTLENSGKVSASHLLDLRAKSAASRGTLMHAWLEMVGFVDEGQVPDTDQLRQCAAEIQPDIPEDYVQQLIGQFNHALANKDVANCLSRRGAVQLWRERPFTVRDGAYLLSGRFDRVAVTCNSADQPEAAALIDFKTDSLPNPASADFTQCLDDKVGFYRPQLQSYQRAVSKLLNIKQDKVATTLLFLNAPCVVEGV